MVCGYATVMVALTEPDVELDAVRAAAVRGAAQTARAATSTVGDGVGPRS